MIEIVTIGEVGRTLLEELRLEIMKTFSSLAGGCLIGPSLEMPPAAYNSSRGQYDADIILDRIQHRIPGNQKVLALLDVDLYTSSRDLNFIFGQAQYPGRIAIVSLFRLNPEFYGEQDGHLLLERAKKEVIHELGHTFGLGHCPDSSCVMSFSNSILEVDRKGKSLCKGCLRKLHRGGPIHI